jgi:hypothetical protein
MIYIYDKCSICQEDIGQKTFDLGIISCKHVHCYKCIKTCAEYLSNKCPICKCKFNEIKRKNPSNANLKEKVINIRNKKFITRDQEIRNIITFINKNNKNNKEFNIKIKYIKKLFELNELIDQGYDYILQIMKYELYLRNYIEQKEDIKNIAIKIREETKKKTDFICKLTCIDLEFYIKIIRLIILKE